MLKQVSARKYSRLQRIVMEAADSIWFVSEIERDRLTAGVSRGKTRLVPNGADDELWLVPPLEVGRPRRCCSSAQGSMKPMRLVSPGS